MIGNPDKDWRNNNGMILDGPEFLTVFEGATGKELATIPFEPARGDPTWWGDNTGNRVDRFLAGTAYLDGKRPSVIMARGYYTGRDGTGPQRDRRIQLARREDHKGVAFQSLARAGR